MVLFPPFLFCLPSFPNKPSSSVMKILWKPVLSYLVACSYSLQNQPHWVTCRWLKFTLQRGTPRRFWSFYQYCLNTPVRTWMKHTGHRRACTWHWPLCYDYRLMCNLLREVLVQVTQCQLERTAYPVMEVSVCLCQPSELPHPAEHVTVTIRVYYPKRYVIITLRGMLASLTAKILR